MLLESVQLYNAACIAPPAYWQSAKLPDNVQLVKALEY